MGRQERAFLSEWWATTWGLSRHHFAVHAAGAAVIGAAVQAYSEGLAQAMAALWELAASGGIGASIYAIFMLVANGARAIPRIYRDQQTLIHHLRGLPIYLREQDMEDGVCRVYLANHGPTDTFIVNARYAVLLGPDVFPSPLRWKGSDEAKQEIVQEQNAILEIAQVEHTRDTTKSQNDQVVIDGVSLLTPKGEIELPVGWLGNQKRLMKPLTIFCELASVNGNGTLRFTAHLNVGTTGHSKPQIDWLIRKED